jgi:hypothetical protein
MVARIVPVDENTVIFSYAGDEPLQQAIAAVKENTAGLAADEGIAKITKLLPRDALVRMYISPSGVLEFVRRVAVLAIPPGANVNLHIPELGATPPVAVGVKSGQNEVEAQLIVPPELLEQIGQQVTGGAPAEKEK